VYDTTVLRPFGARDSSAITQRDPRPQEPGIGEPGTEAADRADAECVHLSELARIDNKTPVAEAAIEQFERKLRIGRVVKSSNDVTLHLRIEKKAEAELCHAFDQHLIIASITRGARENSAFLFQFLQRLVECQDNMRRGRVTELAVLVEALQLREEIEAEAARGTLCCHEVGAAAKDEGKTGHALDAFVRG